MKTIYLTFVIVVLVPTILSAQLIEAEGDVKLDNTLELCDDSSGESVKVGSLFATYPAGASSANSPSLTLATETSPIFPNTFADITVESSDLIYLNTNTQTRLSVGPSGRVGIGTILPNKLLHVNGDAVIGGGSSDHDGASEHLRFEALNEDWHIGALNEASQAASDFIIGLSSGNSSYFQIENGGDIGMGTSDPIARLHLEDAGHQFVMRNSDDATNTWYMGASAPTWFAGDHKLVFDDDNSTQAPILCLDGTEEAVSIGTSYVPAGYRLAVNGSAIAEEMVIELREDWPDYVFQKDYQLTSLDDVKKSIEKNGHLPGIPSAKQIREEGLALGDMQRRMMEKIEELTLHLIQLDHDNKDLRSELATLKQSIQLGIK